MKKFYTLIVIVILFILSGSLIQASPSKRKISIVPLPAHVKEKCGKFILNSRTTITIPADSMAAKVADFFQNQIRQSTGISLLTGGTASQNVITLKLDGEKELGDEGYRLMVNRKNISVSAYKPQGLFYGIQSLLQMFPPEIMSSKVVTGVKWVVPCAEIKDVPRYPYRGMHLDVSRHFFPKDFVKRYIDLLAMFRMNTFHWHLTDDQGWRIEIKKYPKLTEIGAWHVDRENLPWMEREPQKSGEKATYGGYYTQDDIREIVKYASDRFVTIIPEIEMPAHCLAVLTAYPQLSCTGGPFTVPTGSYWPNIDIFCAGNDSTFIFLQDVLDEVIGLFPSKYIHIGGDEADKTNWKICPKCQKRIKDENLKDENELQSYFIRRIEKYLISKNRKLIGWDEILEGGLAPEATVMSWRGVEGGIQAAKMGHNVIMTPGSHCYLDYYQADPDFEPKAIGGFITLAKVYSLEPTPEELSPEQQKYILGAQGNLWAEYISTPWHAEYMAIPRMIALSEVDWSPKNLRNWNDFNSRLNANIFTRLQIMGVNFSKGSYKIDFLSTATGRHKMKVSLSTERLNPEIRYTLDGSVPGMASKIYRRPLKLSQSTTLKAAIFEDGKLMEKPSVLSLVFSMSTGRELKLATAYSNRYPAQGNNTLVDGLRGSINHRDGNWQGYLATDLDAMVDLGKVMPVNKISIGFLQNQNAWIFMPSEII
ncbi:MAG TPA: family 20 glycosylhydrolase, partial [Bacteroidales bacterium]|nr:family 20 glycosylhydrolase [Bacteroidales bacterium]